MHLKVAICIIEVATGLTVDIKAHEILKFSAFYSLSFDVSFRKIPRGVGGGGGGGGKRRSKDILGAHIYSEQHLILKE